MNTTNQREQVPLRFKQFRRHLGLNQTEMGERIGMVQTGVSAIESARNEVTLSTLYELAALSCNLNWLILGTGPMLITNDPAPSVDVRRVAGATEYVLRVPDPAS